MKRKLAIGLGLAIGGYLMSRRKRTRAPDREPLRDHGGDPIDPILVELEGGERVEAVAAGEGPALLLIPGLSGDKEVFRKQIAVFSAEYRVISFDLRLDFEDIERDFDQFARDAARVLDAAGAPSAIVLGLSFGGAIAMRFASLHPERLEALILTNTLACLQLDHVGFNRTLLIPLALLSTRALPDGWSRRLARVWGRLGVWVFDPSPGNAEIVDYYLRSPARVPVAHGTRRMETFRERDLRSDLPNVRAPALVIRGDTDTYCPRDWQKEIARLLPDSSYVEIPGAGHLALISHPEVFNRTVLEWLREVGAARSGAPSAWSLDAGSQPER